MSELLEIARVGKFTALNGKPYEFTDADLEGIATSFNATTKPAPLVKGHPEVDSPAEGWTKRLVFENGRLLAEPERVNKKFQKLVNRGSYPHISSSLYPPDHPANPTKASAKPTWYLRHIGFLGAHPPGMPGLKPAHFADCEEGVVTIQFAAPKEANNMPGEAENTTVPGLKKAVKKVLQQEKEESDKAAALAAQTASFAEKEKTLAERERQIAEKEAAVVKQQALIAKQQREASFVSFADGLVKEGKLLPVEKAVLVPILASISDSQTVSFGEGDKAQTVSVVESLKKLLTDGLAKRVEFGETGKAADGPGKPGAYELPRGSTGAIVTGGTPAAANFAAPMGSPIDGDRLELHQKALKMRAVNPNLSYEQAVIAAAAGQA